MADELQLSALQVETGPLALDGETLVGIVVDDSFAWSVDLDHADDVTAHEVTPASDESRLTGVAAVTLTDDADSWLVTITGTTALDLSDVSDRGGIVWCRPGATDAERAIVGYSDDPGGADGAYLPTWPDGLFSYEIKPISFTVAGVDETDGDYDADALATALLATGSFTSPDQTVVITGDDTAWTTGEGLTYVIPNNQFAWNTTTLELKPGNGVDVFADLDAVGGGGGGGSLSLGETSSTAYRGDRGKTAYDHSQLTSGNPHNVTKADVGLGSVTNDAQVRASDVDTDGTLAANSDSKVASQKATKTAIATGVTTAEAYADTAVANEATSRDAAIAASAAGLDWKNAVRLVATTNLSLTGAATIDSVAVTTGMRVLVAGQTTASANGIYVASTSGAWARATDADSSAEVTSGMAVTVTGGTVYANTSWVLVTDDPITLNTTALTFSRQAVNASPIGAASGDLAGSYPNPTVVLGGPIHAATAKTTPVDADEIPLSDSAASNVVKKVTWANVKATLRTAFDLVYAGIANPTTRTAAFTAAAGEDPSLDTTSGTFAATIPTGVPHGSVIELKWTAGTVAPTYVLSGSDVLNKTGGSTSGTFQALNQVVALTYNATAGIWRVATSLAASTVVLSGTATTKGDLFVATGAGTYARQGAGTDGLAVRADSTLTNGIGYGVPTTGLGRYQDNAYDPLSRVNESLGAAAGFTPGANAMSFALVEILEPIKIDGSEVYIQTAAAGAKMRYGLYLPSTSTGLPTGTAVVSSNEVDASTTAYKVDSFTKTGYLMPGLYWKAIACSNGTAAYRSSSLTIPSISLGIPVSATGAVLSLTSPWTYSSTALPDVSAFTFTPSTSVPAPFAIWKIRRS